jgi:hypothetical protein
MGGTRKIGIPRKQCKDEVEEDLNIMEIKNRQAASREHQEGRKILLEAKVHNGQ